MGGTNSKICSCKHCVRQSPERAVKTRHQSRDNSVLTSVLVNDLSQRQAGKNRPSTGANNFNAAAAVIPSPTNRPTNRQEYHEQVDVEIHNRSPFHHHHKSFEPSSPRSLSSPAAVMQQRRTNLSYHRAHPPPFPPEEVLELLPSRNIQCKEPPQTDMGSSLLYSPGPTTVVLDHGSSNSPLPSSQPAAGRRTGSNASTPNICSCMPNLFELCCKCKRTQAASNVGGESKESKDKHRMTSNHESFLISTNNDKDMDEWVRAIHRIILSPFGGGIFGQALEETLRHDKRLEERNTCVVSEREVPVIVENCVHFIRKNGMTEEGIFRLNGNTNEVKALEDEYNAGERPIFDNATDVHAVSSLLKLYLRKLPVPVIPFNQFDDLISIAKLAIHHRNDTEEERAAVDDEVSRKIFHHIGLLPPANHSLLRYLARFLYEVSQSSEYNKMDISNLALVIAPNLIHTKLNDAMAMMNFQTHIRYIMEQFISGHRKYFPDESLPDVAARTNIFGSPTTTTVTAQASSNSNLRDPGIGTLNSTASPLGTLDQSHAAAARQYPQAAEDSGTGSLGPTPDNTYRPPVSSSSVASGSTTSATRIKPAKPPRRKPTTPAHHSSGGGTSDGERLAEAEKRRSVYDNINQATHQATAVNITNGDDTKSVSSYSTISSHINQPTIQSSIDSGDKASIKAYRGSSSEQESLHTVDYYERCGSTRQETMDEVTDDESNTESIVGDRTSQSISSLVDQSTFNMGSYSSIKSLAKSPVASTSVESARPGTSGLRARRCAKNDVNDLISKSESDPPLTTVTSLNPPFDGHLMLSSLTPSKPDSSSVSTDTTGNKPTYQELEQTIQYLKNEVKRMNKEQEKRSRMIEDHLLDKMRLGGNFSAPITSANATFTYPTPEITSGTSSVVGYDSSVFELSFSEMSTSNSNSNPSTPAQHERRYWEEVKRHKMTCIQLRNAMRGLEQEKMRNITLQKEMQEFYTTFSNLTSDDVNPKSSAT